jgi:hypothetical protein
MAALLEHDEEYSTEGKFMTHPKWLPYSSTTKNTEGNKITNPTWML